MRKFLYVDIAPNLYIGTQYLRAIFGDSVKDYGELRSRAELEFREDQDLEVLCILPQQLENFVSKFDYVHNAHSFVEMPREVIANYARLIQELLTTSSTVTLVSYDGFDERTVPPEELPNFFDLNFIVTSEPTLTPNRHNFHFVSIN